MWHWQQAVLPAAQRCDERAISQDSGEHLLSCLPNTLISIKMGGTSEGANLTTFSSPELALPAI